MGTIASQITNFTIVYSTVYSDADQRRHQSSSLAFVRGNYRGLVNCPHKWPVTQINVSTWWRHHVISGFLWHPPHPNSKQVPKIQLYNEFENHTFQITATSPRAKSADDTSGQFIWILCPYSSWLLSSMGVLDVKKIALYQTPTPQQIAKCITLGIKGTSWLTFCCISSKLWYLQHYGISISILINDRKE